MHQDPAFHLRSLPTVQVYDPVELEQHLASLAAECARLRGRLASARRRRAIAEVEAERGDPLRLHVGAAVLAAQAELDGERQAHEQAIAGLVAATDAEVERILAEAQAEADALRAAVGELLPPDAAVRGTAPAPAARISAEQTPPALELVRDDTSMAV